MEEKKGYSRYRRAFWVVLSWLIIVVAGDSIGTYVFGAPLLWRLTYNVGIFCAYVAMYLIMRYAWEYPK